MCEPYDHSIIEVRVSSEIIKTIEVQRRLRFQRGHEHEQDAVPALKQLGLGTDPGKAVRCSRGAAEEGGLILQGGWEGPGRHVWTSDLEG